MFVFGRHRQNDRPLFDYEKIIYDNLISLNSYFTDKHLWVKKATGLGVTEFMLRLMAWLCTSGISYRNCQTCIVLQELSDVHSARAEGLDYG
jgi:hypothetical protein